MKLLSLLSILYQKFQFYFYQKKVNEAVDDVSASKTDEGDIHALQELDDATYGKEVPPADESGAETGGESGAEPPPPPPGPVVG